MGKTSEILDVGCVYGHTFKFHTKIGLSKAECLYVCKWR